MPPAADPSVISAAAPIPVRPAAHGAHHHPHGHSHGHSHRHPAARPSRSLLRLSIWQRLAIVVPIGALLWALALWVIAGSGS